MFQESRVLRRIAALYDIHGNLPALEAVLDELAGVEVDGVVVGGDVVPGPMPSECLALLRETGVPTWCISGNGEADTVVAHSGQAMTRVPPAFHETMLWTARALSAADHTAIASWQASSTLDVADLGLVHFCHATPRDDNEIFTEQTPTDRLLPVFDSIAAKVVICGHTHMQFDRTVGDIRVVNAGSVGMPFGEPTADWAIVGADGIELRQTVYDLEAASQRIAATEYPVEFDPRHPPSAEHMLAVFEAVALQ
jgi:putative phosphoesterase